MDLFAIMGTLWRHKWVSIPVLLLTLVGTAYVVMIRSPSYQAKANVLFIYPPATPTAFEIEQDPALAKVNNPYANLGNETYLADVMSTLLSSSASQRSLEAEGVAQGYQVTVDTSGEASGQAVAPPALDITGVGSNPQAAIQSAKLVADAVSTDLRQLQQSQHVQSNSMVTAVEYVTPSSAVESSSGKIKMAVGVAVIGFIVLLVAVSLAQGREERRNGRASRGRQSDPPVGGRREPVRSPADAQHAEPRPEYGERQRLGTDNSRSPGPGQRTGMQRFDDNGQ
jgi:hypothetical protein